MAANYLMAVRYSLSLIGKYSRVGLWPKTDLKSLQQTLGHADLATTSIYVSLAKKAQRQALQEHAL